MIWVDCARRLGHTSCALASRVGSSHRPRVGLCILRICGLWAVHCVLAIGAAILLLGRHLPPSLTGHLSALPCLPSFFSSSPCLCTWSWCLSGLLCQLGTIPSSISWTWFQTYLHGSGTTCWRSKLPYQTSQITTRSQYWEHEIGNTISIRRMQEITWFSRLS